MALFAIAFFSVNTAAYAGEALPQLKGTWVAETIGGKPPKAPAKLVMTFVDDQTLRSAVTGRNGKTQEVEIKYAATPDGKLVMIPDPKDNPDGEKGTWEIKDGKLHIASEDGAAMVLVRPK